MSDQIILDRLSQNRGHIDAGNALGQLGILAQSQVRKDHYRAGASGSSDFYLLTGSLEKMRNFQPKDSLKLGIMHGQANHAKPDALVQWKNQLRPESLDQMSVEVEKLLRLDTRGDLALGHVGELLPPVSSIAGI